MSKLASLLVKITANGAQAERELKELSKKTEDFGKKMKNVGASMTKYVTGPILALAAVSVKAANDQQQAEAKLLTALKGREDIQKRLLAQASEMQSRTLFGDEEIISQQAFLAALGLSEQQINDTMEAAIQLSAALGMELEAAVKNLAKTYGGLSGELGESIPALKNLTAEQMKAGEAIKYVNDNYKGFAETAAKTGTGTLSQLKNQLGDLAEQLGVILIPVLQEMVDWLSNMATWFQNLSPATQEMIVGFASVAAAIGPVLTVGGKLLTMLPLIKAAFTAMTGPIGLAVAAIAALVGAFVSLQMQEAEYARSLAEREAQMQQEQQAKLDKTYSDTYNEYSRPIYSDDDIIAKREAVAKSWTDMRSKYMVGGFTEAEAYGLNILHQAHRALSDILDQRKRSAEDAAAMQAKYNDTLEQTTSDVEEATGVIGRLQAQMRALEESLVNANTVEEIARINAELEKTNEEITRLQNIKPGDINKQRVSMLPIVGDAPSFGVSGPKATDLLMGVNNINMETFRANALQVAERIKGVIAEMNSIVSGAMSALAVTIGEGIGSMLAGEDFDWANRLLGAIGDMLKQLGAALIAYATALEAFKNAFKNPWVALAAGIAAVAAGTAVKAIANKPIKLATGGLAYGPTLAVVGDNPGATNDPEVVAPLSKLRNFMGGQKLELVGDVAFELHGDTMRALLDRNNLRLATLG